MDAALRGLTVSASASARRSETAERRRGERGNRQTQVSSLLHARARPVCGSRAPLACTLGHTPRRTRRLRGGDLERDRAGPRGGGDRDLERERDGERGMVVSRSECRVSESRRRVPRSEARRGAAARVGRGRGAADHFLRVRKDDPNHGRTEGARKREKGEKEATSDKKELLQWVDFVLIRFLQM